ncbi:MAG: Verru_Chthon cassette protein B [Verrucomicrobiales bacterium]|nr:Verru_Chthon cassette protein B [Verrucomicrobiales bacterium]
MEYKKSKTDQAFSLVEVSIAMAIAALALVSLIGLIPQGLQTMREAGDQAIEARIHQQILSELQMTPVRDASNSPNLTSSPLRQFHRQVRAYDAQGVELAYSDGTGGFVSADGFDQDQLDFSWSYTARIWLPDFASGNTPDVVGNGKVDNSEDGPTGATTYELFTVIIETVPLPFASESGDVKLDGSLSSLADSFLSNEDNFRQINVFQTTVVRMGSDS